MAGPTPRANTDAPSPGPMLRAEALRLRYDRRVVVDDVHLDVPPGRITAIVGANGSGKSTLLRALARLLRPAGGQVLLDGQELASAETKALARRLGLLPQGPIAPEGLTVEDLVARGRYPHQRLFRRWAPHDTRHVDDALAQTGMTDLRNRPVDELSGGQRQRAWIAMALAQDTEIMLLDEPTTYLDLAHQLEVLDLLTDLNEHRGRTVVMVLHDLGQACRYAHHLVALRDGRIHAAGAPTEIVDADLVAEVFGVQCRVWPCPVSGTPLCLPLGRADRGGVTRWAG